MAVGKYPFVAETIVGLLAAIGKCEYELPDTLSDELSDLIQRILIKDENTRYTIPEIEKHQYIIYSFPFLFLYSFIPYFFILSLFFFVCVAVAVHCGW